MTQECMKEYVDIYNAIELLYTKRYIDEKVYKDFQGRLLYAIIGSMAIRTSNRTIEDIEKKISFWKAEETAQKAKEAAD